MKEKRISERFDSLGTYSSIEVFDVEHAIEQFKNRFPKLHLNAFYKTLDKGIRKIVRTYDYRKQQNYLIISYKYGLRIPIEIRPDRKNAKKIVGIIATTLSEDMYRKLRNEIDILVEQYKKEKVSYGSLPDWGDTFFIHFYENGRFIQNYESIDLDIIESEIVLSKDEIIEGKIYEKGTRLIVKEVIKE